MPARLEALAALAGLSRPAVHAQIASALHASVHITRDGQGRRRVSEISVFTRDPDTGLTRTEQAVAFGADGVTRVGPGGARLERMLDR